MRIWKQNIWIDWYTTHSLQSICNISTSVLISKNHTLGTSSWLTNKFHKVVFRPDTRRLNEAIQLLDVRPNISYLKNFIRILVWKRKAISFVTKQSLNTKTLNTPINSIQFNSTLMRMLLNSPLRSTCCVDVVLRSIVDQASTRIVSIRVFEFFWNISYL